MPLVSVVVVNWNTRELLARCLESIRPAAGIACEMIVVDNGSTDGSQAMVRERFAPARLLANADNVGFAQASNQGAAAARGDYVLLLNSDAQLLDGALAALVELAAAQPKAAAVGARLLDIDHTFQASHGRFPTLGRELLILSGIGRLLYGGWYPSSGPDEQLGPQPVEWVGGACMLLRRAAFDAVGGLDEGYFMYAEEMDLCYRLRAAGWEVWYQPAATVLHVGSASSVLHAPRREALLYRGRVRFFRKHHGAWKAVVLMCLIFTLTAIKIPVHVGLRAVSRGRWGRPVVSLRQLALAFKDR